MPISALRDRVRSELLEFAWSQWAHLGLSAHATRNDRWALDPEALILFTVEVARRDPRLFDEMLDWICLNADLLSLQRLRNLARRFPIDSELTDAVVAWVTEEEPSVRWHTAGDTKDSAKSRKTPLFSEDVASYVGDPDPVFESHGYLRSRATRSHKSTEPDIRAGTNLAFRLRLFLGLGSRAEILRILITSKEGPLDAARLADEAGFAKRNVNEALKGLVSSEVVKARWSGNKRVFLAYRNKWATLLEIGPTAEHLPTFVSWVHLFPALLEVMRWLESEGEPSESDYLVSSRARDLVERIKPDLEAAELDSAPREFLRGTEYLPFFEETVGRLLAAIAEKAEVGSGHGAPSTRGESASPSRDALR